MATEAHGHRPAAVDDFVRRMDEAMDRMMRDMPARLYSGDRDVDFLTMMIPHHQGAIDMARLALLHGADPLTRGLAEQIIAAQTAEIEAMRGRLAVLRAGAAEFPALSGTRGDMRCPRHQN